MRQPQGHSNVYADQTQPYPTNPANASIPIIGGATVHTVRPLPPLVLSREEWQEIGERMGWAKYRLTADVAAREETGSCVKYVCAEHAQTAKTNNRVVKNQTHCGIRASANNREPR